MLSIIVYISALVGANLAAAHFGPAATPVIGFFLIALDMTLRDRLHDEWRGKSLWPRMIGLIAAAGALSYILNPASGQIALASVAAFCLSSLMDAIVYHQLAHRSWEIRANGSNLAAAVVDSFAFPLIAFGALMPWLVLAQFAAKVAGGAVWATIINRFAVLGYAK